MGFTPLFPLAALRFTTELTPINRYMGLIQAHILGDLMDCFRLVGTA